MPSPVSASQGNIFQDDSGSPIKFFLARDIPEDISAPLQETISEMGGIVVTKVPIKGYILFVYNTEEDDRLRTCWQKPERPHRHFVPYTYVEACKIAGTRLKQIFVQDGVPMIIHIHPSIANVNAREALTRRILHAGGEVDPLIQEACVILADPGTDVFDKLVKKYQTHPEKHVESFDWVKKCVERDFVEYTPVVHKNAGGRKAGDERVEFTADDDLNLCSWIAKKIPDKATGGRTGNKIYQELTELADEPGYSWVSRHSWHSWRERYKKRSDTLDRLITSIVQDQKIQVGEKGQHGYVRKVDERDSPRKRRRLERSPSPDNDEPPRRSSRLPKDMVHVLDFAKDGEASSASREAESRPKGKAKRQPRDVLAEVDAEDTWRVRIGNDPPPAWAKPLTPYSPKAAKSISDPLPFGNPGPGNNNQTSSLSEVLSPPPPGLQKIAQQFRFTLEEVEEYHSRCRDLTETYSRFEKMRQFLNTHFPE